MAKTILTGCLMVVTFLWIAASGWTQGLNGADDNALLSYRRSLAGRTGIYPERLNFKLNYQNGLPNMSFSPADGPKRNSSEEGIQRTDLTADFTLKSNRQLSTYFTRVNDENSGLVKYGLSLKDKKFSIAANFQDIDPEFTRILDLNDPSKYAMAAEQGMKRYDLTAHLQVSKSIAIDRYEYDAEHQVTGLITRRFANSMTISPSRGPRLTMLQDETDSGTSSYLVEILHDRYTLDHKIGILSLSMANDTVDNVYPGGYVLSVDTQTLHFDTDASKRTSLVGDWSSVDQNNGIFRDTQILKLTSKLTSNLDFVGTRTVVATDQYETVLQEYGLTTKVSAGLNLCGQFNEIETNGESIGKAWELKMMPVAGKDFGMLKQTKWNIRVAQDRGASGIGPSGGGIESDIGKHKITLGYLNSVRENGQDLITRSFSINNDQNSKTRLHYSLQYKAHDVSSGSSPPTRNYNIGYQINPSMRLNYYRTEHNELLDGTPDQYSTEGFGLTGPLTKRLNLTGQMTNTSDCLLNTSTKTASLGISGKVSSLGILEASYGFNRVMLYGVETTSRTYILKYDYQVSDEQFFTFSGRFTDWSGPHIVDPTYDGKKFQLEFKTIFN